MAFGRKTKDIDTSKSAFGVGGAGDEDEKEGSQEKNLEFEKQRDEALQVPLISRIGFSVDDILILALMIRFRQQILCFYP